MEKNVRSVDNYLSFLQNLTGRVKIKCSPKIFTGFLQHYPHVLSYLRKQVEGLSINQLV